MTKTRRGVLLVALICLAGCGGSNDTAKRRSAVDAYFQRVDRAELPLQSQIGQIDEAFKAFSFTNTGAKEQRALVRARSAITATRSRVGAIPPPADARAVHADLIRVLTLQESVADELVKSAQFIPRLAATGKPLVAAASQLGRALAAVKAPPPTAAGTGSELWNAAGCGSCHTLAASRSKGAVGPNLDTLRPTEAEVAAKVRRGSAKMPAYGKALTAAQIDAIAVYVSTAAGHASARQGAGQTAPVSAAPDVYTQYAAAFAGYRQALAPILATLDRMTAPAELRPILVAQRHALTGSSTLCSEIEHDLARHDVAAANRAIQRLFEVASGVNGADVSKQQAAAAHVYDARLATIATLSRKIAQERATLEAALQ